MLIDAGLSRREIVKRLAAIGENLADVDAILMTHEHADHTIGLAALVKRKPCDRKMPVFVTRGTTEFIDWGESVRKSALGRRARD